eukprot:TRINITY_DN44625_c0_g1_i1.p1 TRINITY_DN44625_c0_g1~~TRINITY_DN44625_c0_g1_i1.p1  ORF type:complete len:298 (+),score=27.90 TRINITY_DN44625_c0_g1_i1:95-988(+)
MYAHNRIVRVVSVIPVLTVLGVYAFEWYAYNFVVVLRMHGRSADGITPAVIFWAVSFNAAWFLAIWSYLRCCVSEPGLIPNDWHVLENGIAEIRPNDSWNPGRPTGCRHCQQSRPERAHHCRICGRCILRMDHHCPWIGNCVGFNNHKYFILMNMYGALSCWLVVYSTASQLISMVFRSSLVGLKVPKVSSEDGLVFSLAGVIAIACGISLSMLFIAHVVLMANNITVLEMGFFGTNPYNSGPWGNAQQLLGAPDFTWLLPVRPAKPLCDGLSFPTVDPPELATRIGLGIEDSDGSV